MPHEKENIRKRRNRRRYIYISLSDFHDCMESMEGDDGGEVQMGSKDFMISIVYLKHLPTKREVCESATAERERPIYFIVEVEVVVRTVIY